MTPKEQLISALRRLCEEEGGAKGVALQIGASAANLSQILAGTQLPSGEPRGVGPTLQRKLERRFPGWSGSTSNSGSANEGVSHRVRLPDFKVVPTIQWGEMMHVELPETFRLVAPDDAMAPRVKAGKGLIFTTTESPVAGDGVLISDRDGNVYFRLYRVRRAGAWQAYAINDAYQEMDSERDGLRVLAVLSGEEGRWA